MELKPHQKRVVIEKLELDEKLEKLREFMSQIGGVFDSLPREEIKRLIEQEIHMSAYSDVLRRRIEAFEA